MNPYNHHSRHFSVLLVVTSPSLSAQVSSRKFVIRHTVDEAATLQVKKLRAEK
jgi:hypothetical protein